MSSLVDKWYGESQKRSEAVFSLVSKWFNSFLIHMRLFTYSAMSQAKWIHVVVYYHLKYGRRNCNVDACVNELR